MRQTPPRRHRRAPDGAAGPATGSGGGEAHRAQDGARPGEVGPNRHHARDGLTADDCARRAARSSAGTGRPAGGADINYAVDVLEAQPAVWVYLDAGHSQWHSVGDMAARLIQKSDGQCNRGIPGGTVDPEYGIVDPAAGAWWPAQSHALARNANPALTFNPHPF
jgi:hypothetical protein